MHNKKKLLIVSLFVICFLLLSCKDMGNKKTLVIKNVNDGESLIADTEDNWTVGSGEEQEEYSETPSYSVPIEVSYFEGYGGLPTPSSYAQVTDYTVDFRDKTPGVETPAQFPYKVQGGCTFFVQSDPEGKITEKGVITILPREWIILYQDVLEEEKTLLATITLKGKDSSSGEDIEAKGSLLVSIGDFEDDPNKKGQ